MKEEEPRVMLGVPGLDAILLNRGIQQGSLILITGPAGSGKTLLTMQLLMEIHAADWPADVQRTRKASFWSVEEHEQNLKRQLPQLFGLDRQLIEPLPLKSRLLVARQDAIGDECIDRLQREAFENAMRLAADIPEIAISPSQGDPFERFVRRTALKLVLAEATHRLTGLDPEEEEAQDTVRRSRKAIAIDGLLNLPEVRGASLDERRDALYEAAESLRNLMRTHDNYLACILTTESPASEYAPGSCQFEEYLADIVIQLSVDAPAARKRRRLLEVRKARYADAILGEHSLWIMSPGEVERRRSTAAAFGWSDHIFDKHIRPGVVIFPRMRWIAQRDIGPLSGNLRGALTDLGRFIWKHPEGVSPAAASVLGAARQRLRDPAIHAALANLLRGRLTLPDSDPLAEALKAAAGSALNAGWKWPAPQEAPSWPCAVGENLSWSWLAQLKLDEWINDGVEALRVLAISEDRGRQLSEIIARFGKTWSPFHDWSSEAQRAAVLGVIELAMFVEQTLSRRGTSAEPEITGYRSFGIKGLDEMLHHRGDTTLGVRAGSSTVVVGGPGTGKSTLACSFMLKGLLGGERVIFLSFDERQEAIMQQIGGLTLEELSSPRLAQGEASHACKTFADAIAAQLLAADPPPDTQPKQETARPGRLCFVHENPPNADLDLLIELLTRQVLGPADQPPTRDKRPGEHCRLIVDSLSDLERNIRDPLVFNDLVRTLLHKAADWGVTTLLIYEAEVSGDTVGALASGLSFLSDNVISLRQVEVNNAMRKCVTIQKARGCEHDLSPRELTFHRGPDRTFFVKVQKGFEGMTRVLSGRPQPASIELRLFHENEAERGWNEAFVRDMRQRFGERIREVPFTLPEIRRTFWERLRRRDVRPDADVTVVALDQPWVRIFASTSAIEGSPLAAWSPDRADPSERLLISHLHRRLRDHATVDRPDFESEEQKAERPALQPLLAVPHYYDLGLLVQRTDLLQGISPPTYWDAATDAPDHGSASF